MKKKWYTISLPAGWVQMSPGTRISSMGAMYVKHLTTTFGKEDVGWKHATTDWESKYLGYSIYTASSEDLTMFMLKYGGVLP